jgi:hypothetical protein
MLLLLLLLWGWLPVRRGHVRKFGVEMHRHRANDRWVVMLWGSQGRMVTCV